MGILFNPFFMKNLFIISLLLISFGVVAQDLVYTKSVISELCKEKYFGRGYVNNGDSIAASYLANEFEKIGLDKYKNSYYQEYTTDINRLIEMPVFVFGDQELEPAYDYIVIPSSPDVEGKFKIEWITKTTLTNQWVLRHFLTEDHSQNIICIDSTELNNPELYAFANTIFSKNYIGAKGVIEGSGRLKYTARTKLNEHINIQIVPGKINREADSVYIKIVNDFVEDYKTKNVVGYLKGKTDSIVLFTAHYDHLGMMGNVMYPGANDNASGVSMVLNLAKYYQSEKKLPYTMVFVLFSGEEAGLLGSTYMTENPPFELSKIKVMFNFDMVGTGEKGVMMLNAKEYPDVDSLINEMNINKDYFDQMTSTGATWSSDHAPFYEKGVKAVFICTHGANSNYHQPTDIPEDLNLAAYEDIFRFVIDFVNRY